MIAPLDLSSLIGPAIGVVGIAISAYLWRRSRVRPAISYQLTSKPVVNVNRQVEQRITVLYDGVRVPDVRLLDLRVANTGNVDISPDKFEEPLSVALGPKATVLAPPTVGKTVPPELRPRVSVDGDALVVAPLLLNPGDSFEVTALISGLTAGDRLRARIAGVPRLVNAGIESGESHAGWRNSFSLPILGGLTLVAIVFGVLNLLGLTYEQRKSRLDNARPHQHSLVVLRTGPALCGDVLRVDTKTILLKLKKTGTLRSLPVTQTKAIRDKAC